MIPRIIHQIWLGPNPIPIQFKEWQKTILKHNPPLNNPASTERIHQTIANIQNMYNWQYHLWTDDNIQEFNATGLLNECDSLAGKSDVIRILALIKYGGVYLDMDVECLKPLHPLLNVPAFVAKESDNVVCNAIFGTIPNHPWLLKQMHLLPTLVDKPTSWGVTLMSEQSLKIDSGVTIYPKEFFYPFLWDIPLEYRKPHKNSYLVHHWNKSWIT